MRFILGLAQCTYPADGNVLRQVATFAERAHRYHVDYLVFPENLMCPRDLTSHELARIAEPLDGPFLSRVCDIAERYGLWIVGCMSEANQGGRPPFNTAFAIDDRGELRGTYRKTHLYDAHSVRESDRMTAGDELCAPIATSFGALGIGICYDLRFPEVARSLVLDGCNLLVYPAAWHAGPQKAQHWETLLRARAIENECFVAGVCHAGERFVGHSIIVSPLGETISQGPGQEVAAGDREALVIGEINTAEVRDARSAMPILEHRRPPLYTRIVQA